MAEVKQTMISVKKSDGSTVKMSLSDFKKYQAELAQKKQSTNDLPARIQNESLATTAPVVKAFVNEAQATVSENTIKSAPAPQKVEIKPDEKVSSQPSVPSRPPVRLTQRPVPNKPKQWSRDDYASPLNEEVKTPSPVIPPEPNSKVDVGQIIAGSGLSIPEGIKSRMTNLVTSVVDGVRDRTVAIEFATRPIANGGLGLNEAQVSALMNKIDEATKSTNTTPRQITHVLPENLRPKKPELGVERTMGQAGNLTPDKKITNPEARPMNDEKKPVGEQSGSEKLDKIVRSDSLRSAPVLPIVKPSSPMRSPMEMKTPIADIKMPVRERILVGPIDEFASMTLTDWRRMAVNTEGSLNLLMNKFEALMRESYTLFLAARDAWRDSELFQMYISIIQKSISERRPVEEVIGNTPNLPNMAEFRALVELNESISN